MDIRKVDKWFRVVIVAGVLFLLALFFVVGGASAFAHNAGTLYQNQALAQQRESDKVYYLERSVAFFDLATQLNGDNRRAWRSLGYSHLYLDQVEQALSAWQGHGAMADELLARALLAEKGGDVEAALFWHDKVTLVAPTWSEGWFASALFFEGIGELDEAMAAYERSIATAVPASCTLSEGYYRLGKVHQSRAEQGDVETAVALIETALNQNNFCDPKIEAEAHYTLGEMYTRQGYPNQTSLDQFKEAVRLNPNHQWANLRLSLAQYQEDGDWQTAVDKIQAVIVVWEQSKSPNQKWGYRYLGDVYLQAGQPDKAVSAYQQLLSLEATNQYAQERITAILSGEEP